MAKLEPWPGYAGLSESKKLATFKVKVEDARLRRDILYAYALATAVSSFEALEGANGGSAKLKTEAQKLIDAVAKGAEPGSWGHG